MKIVNFFREFNAKILRDQCQQVKITCIDDFKKTAVSYKQRIINENWTFDTKPRDADTGNEIAVNNQFVLEYLTLERRLSSYKNMDLWKYVENFVNSRKYTKILSIGAGPAAVEQEIAVNFKSKNYQLDCIDLNEKLVKYAIK